MYVDTMATIKNVYQFIFVFLAIINLFLLIKLLEKSFYYNLKSFTPLSGPQTSVSTRGYFIL